METQLLLELKLGLLLCVRQLLPEAPVPTQDPLRRMVTRVPFFGVST